MVTCSRRHAKSTLGRGPLARWDAGLTVGDAGSSVELAVVTTSSAGKFRLWPTAFSLAEAVVAASAEGGVAGDDWLSLDPSQGKCFSSKGRLVFHTAKTRWRSLRMQWPSATSPRLPLALSRRYRARRAGLCR